MRFPSSRLFISVIPPVLLGAFVGVLSAIMGVGGGFILVPATGSLDPATASRLSVVTR